LFYRTNCWLGQKYFPELVFTQTLAAAEDSVDVAVSPRESGGADPFAPDPA
jgi:hypothetical protein